MQEFLSHSTTLFALFALRCLVPLLFTMGAGMLLNRLTRKNPPGQIQN